jgi:hypothetical protein
MSQHAIRLQNVSKLERMRWLEVMNSATVMNASRDDEGFLVLELDDDDAMRLGVYSYLYINAKGRVAQAMVNQPHYFPTFAYLLAAKS